jgi:hypothetical protein
VLECFHKAAEHPYSPKCEREQREWEAARQQRLVKDKALMRAGDALARRAPADGIDGAFMRRDVPCFRPQWEQLPSDDFRLLFGSFQSER